MVRSRWKGGLPRTIRKEVQRVQRNARRREQYAIKKREQKIASYKGKTVRDAFDKDTQVGLVYKKNSKVMPRPEGYIAVRLKDGRKGWIREGGDLFVSPDQVGWMLRGVDKACHNYGKYEDLWNGMSPMERARFMEMEQNIDWDAFWKTKYDERTGLLDGEAIATIEEVFNYALTGDRSAASGA